VLAKKGPSGQAGALKLEPTAGYSSQTGPAAIRSLMAERVTWKPQVILSTGLCPKLDPGQSKERLERYVQISPFWRQLLKKRTITWNLRIEVCYGASISLMNFARPPALVVWWGSLRLAAAGSSRLAASSRNSCAVCACRRGPPRSQGPTWSP
jgi:hypothetical protein